MSKELKEVKRKILVFDSCKGRKVFSIKQSFPKGSSDIRNTDKYEYSLILLTYYFRISLHDKHLNRLILVKKTLNECIWGFGDTRSFVWWRFGFYCYILLLSLYCFTVIFYFYW